MPVFGRRNTFISTQQINNAIFVFGQRKTQKHTHDKPLVPSTITWFFFPKIFKSLNHSLIIHFIILFTLSIFFIFYGARLSNISEKKIKKNVIMVLTRSNNPKFRSRQGDWRIKKKIKRSQRNSGKIKSQEHPSSVKT